MRDRPFDDPGDADWSFVSETDIATAPPASPAAGSAADDALFAFPLETESPFPSGAAPGPMASAAATPARLTGEIDRLLRAATEPDHAPEAAFEAEPAPGAAVLTGRGVSATGSARRRGRRWLVPAAAGVLGAIALGAGMLNGPSATGDEPPSPTTVGAAVSSGVGTAGATVPAGPEQEGAHLVSGILDVSVPDSEPTASVPVAPVSPGVAAAMERAASGRSSGAPAAAATPVELARGGAAPRVEGGRAAPTRVPDGLAADATGPPSALRQSSPRSGSPSALSEPAPPRAGGTAAPPAAAAAGPTDPLDEPGDAGIPPSVLASTAVAPPLIGPAPAIEAGAPARTAEDLVRQTLQSYRVAYEALDVAAAAAVWPSVDRRSLSRAFSALVSQQLHFDSCAITVADLSATAACEGTLQFVRRVGSPAPVMAGQQWVFRMRHADGDWRIDEVSASPAR
jgi:hypothetical protein